MKNTSTRADLYRKVILTQSLTLTQRILQNNPESYRQKPTIHMIEREHFHLHEASALAKAKLSFTLIKLPKDPTALERNKQAPTAIACKRTVKPCRIPERSVLLSTVFAVHTLSSVCRCCRTSSLRKPIVVCRVAQFTENLLFTYNSYMHEWRGLMLQRDRISSAPATYTA